MSLSTLVAISNKYGQNPDLVLAGGGNTSVKENGVMFVKASGTSLGTITEAGFVSMDVSALNKIIDKPYPENDAERERLALQDMMDARMPNDREKRPSVEALLHALFPQKYVVHLHPALVNGMTCGKNGEAIARELFGESIIWIGPCKPGLVLAKLCAEKLCAYKASTGKEGNLIILENHGIFFAAETPEEIESMLSDVMAKLSGVLKEGLSADAGTTSADAVAACTAKIRARMGDATLVAFEGSANTMRFTGCSHCVKPLMKPFTPDHIVYCRAYFCFAESVDAIPAAIDAYEAAYGMMPRVLIVAKTGAFICEQTEKNLERALLLFRDAVKVAIYAASFGGVSPMPDWLTEFIVNWEVESYRSKQG